MSIYSASHIQNLTCSRKIRCTGGRIKIKVHKAKINDLRTGLSHNLGVNTTTLYTKVFTASGQFQK